MTKGKSGEVQMVINGEVAWFDFDEYTRHQKFLEDREKEYWRWILSGKRTLEMFGEEGAKRVLEEQRKRDEQGIE